MAKMIPLYPETKGNGTTNMDDTEWIELLRAVVDGDEEAREVLRGMLDAIEAQTKGGLPEIDSKALCDENAKNVRELHIRVKLNYIDVAIWRELKVPSNLKLYTFAGVLIDAMGWEGRHLFQFKDGKIRYCTEDAFEDVMFGGRDMRHMRQFTVGDLLTEKDKCVKFEYDFGDSWTHDVWLVDEREYENGEPKVVACFNGQGCCPPEDCGGVFGYMELIMFAQKKRLLAAERERLEWYGLKKGFDPNEYDAELYEFEDEL